jgi:hypothetical protein
MKARKIPLCEIRLNDDLRLRKTIRPDVIEEYADALRRDGVTKFPALLVCEIGGDHWLVDGFHRYDAAKLVGLEVFPCEVETGASMDDALWFACGANSQHGLRRSNADKERAVEVALRNPRGLEKSDREIARHVGVTDKTVAKFRRRFESTSEISKSILRRGADGRVIDVSKIGPKAPKTSIPAGDRATGTTSPAPIPATDAESPARRPTHGVTAIREGGAEADPWQKIERLLAERLAVEGPENFRDRLRDILARRGLLVDLLRSSERLTRPEPAGEPSGAVGADRERPAAAAPPPGARKFPRHPKLDSGASPAQGT